MQRTPGLILGPYYPVQAAAASSTLLWLAEVPPASVGLRAMQLRGRVLNSQGAPLAGARVEVWHADPAGRYRHPWHPEAAMIDDRFSGFGVMVTQEDGAWSFETLFPGCYRHGETFRARHVHFQVTRGPARIVTQMFFPGEPENEVDHWYGAVTNPQRLVARRVEGAPGTPCFEWDIVIDEPGT